MRHLLSLIRPVLVLIFLANWGAVAAQPADPATYEELLSALGSANSQSEADLLAAKVWDVWLTAPDEAAQAVLDTAMERRQAYDFRGAIAELDRLVASYPDYAEGWNQRATMYFMVGDLKASLADVDEVLSREPRHFGALAGKGMILFQQGKVALAQLAVREGLRHHPFLRESAILGSDQGTEL